jgi:hypothetical protein
VSKKILVITLFSSFLFSQSVCAKDFSETMENLREEREVIERQVENLDEEFKVRKEFLEKAIRELDNRERAFRGGCPNPPCELIQ